MANKSKDSAPSRVAFLLSQVGGRSAQEFAKLLAPLKLTPADAGILRLLRHSEGTSQQNLAKRLNMHASRLVALIDALESNGLVVREPNATDRRLYSLKLTSKGSEILHSIGDLARQHNELMCAGLSSAERVQLESLLQKIAEKQGLIPGVHPGYRDIGKANRQIERTNSTAQTGRSTPHEAVQVGPFARGGRGR
ncbi:MAG TPA: MarR family transcriptional regulator [Acidobacteriaceae bacterium]